VVSDHVSGEELPAWVNHLPDRPTVCATLGSVFNRMPEIFRAIIEGLSEEPLNLILTVGHNQDPAEFGPQPANVHIERYIPQ
jgi:UDP:flavonoid glycosyltransferase YjiC (YdhE family)